MGRLSVLYIAFYFPPLGGVASLRALKILKYMPDDIELVVLTVKPRWMRHPKDNSLHKEIPAPAKVYRAFFPDLNWLFKLLWGLKLSRIVDLISQRLLIPGPEVLWLPFAKRKVDAIIRNRPDIKLALVSSGPPATLLLGKYILRRYGVPYVCEFRDEWTNNPERINTYYSAHAQQKELDMESDILKSCRGCVYLTTRMRDNFIARYPIMADKPCLILPNGYDEEDFSGLIPGPANDKMTIVYTGSFYDRRQPDALWKALRGLVDSGRIDRSNLRIEIIGRNTPAQVLGEYQGDPIITALVNFHGFMPHRQSLRHMVQADVLLLFIPSGKNTESVLTGKIFDYLFTGKPVLAIIPPDGAAAELLRNAGTGFIADYQDTAGISAMICDIYGIWCKGQLSKITLNREFISGFSRRRQANNLGTFLSGLLKK